MTKVDVVGAAVARLCAPLLMILGCSALLVWSAGSGIGLVAGICLALGSVLLALVFGVGAWRRAFPPALMRFALAIGLAIAVGGDTLAPRSWSAQLIEAGLFVLTVSGAILAFMGVFGRAPTLSDDAW
jgi:multisubunit Na+/H+ antiporter MnhB subunit